MFIPSQRLHALIRAASRSYWRWRQRIETAAHFLTWLEHNDRTLADATQHHVDTWIAQGASTRRRVRDFLRGAHARGISSDLRVLWLGSEGLAENVLDNDEQLASIFRDVWLVMGV